MGNRSIIDFLEEGTTYATIYRHILSDEIDIITLFSNLLYEKRKTYYSLENLINDLLEWDEINSPCEHGKLQFVEPEYKQLDIQHYYIVCLTPEGLRLTCFSGTVEDRKHTCNILISFLGTIQFLPVDYGITDIQNFDVSLLGVNQ